MTDDPMVRLLTRLYGLLLRAYPAHHRDAVGHDMAECFADLVDEAVRTRGVPGALWVAVRTFAEMPVSVIRAHRETWRVKGRRSADTPEGWTMPGRSVMKGRSTKTSARPRTGESGGGGRMESLGQDVRFAVRGLVRNPGITLLAVLSLGLGVGANTSMFSMIHNTLWAGLPVPEADRLVRVHEVRDAASRVSFANYMDVVDGVDVFEGAFMHGLESWGLVADDLSLLVHGELVTANYFDVLRVEPALGRLIDPVQHGTSASAPVAVIGHYLWTSTFGADPGVVGKVIELNEIPVTIIGVAPEGFHGTKFGLAMDLWVPLRPWALAAGWSEDWSRQRGSRFLMMAGRLTPGIDLEGANAALETLSTRLAGEYPEDDANMTLRATTDVAGQIAPDQAGIPDMIGLLAVLGSGLVLLVACGNVASLLMARAVARRQEIGIRIAMGAGRGRLLRQLLTESAILAAAGALVGIGLAAWSARLDARLLPAIPYRFSIDAALEPTSLAFAVTVSLLAVLVFGLAPALQASRPGIAGVLRGDEAAEGLRMGGGHLLNGVVVGVVALSFVTLFLAGVFTASLAHVRTIEPGFATDGRMIATMDVALAGYAADDAPLFFDELEREVAALPGVDGVAVAASIPFGDFSSSSRVYADDREYADDELGPSAWTTAVRPEWFDVAGIDLLDGRTFTEGDDAETPDVAVINEALARSFWPDEPAVGKRLRFGRDPGEATIEVVGVVETGRYMSLVERPSAALYRPLAQSPRTRVVLMASTGRDPGTLAGPLREAARRVDPSVALYDMKTGRELMANAHWLFRMGAELALAMGFLASALAGGGLYGIMSFRVGQRRREMGIRVALGAGSGRLVRHVLGGTARLVATGVLIGGAMAWGASGLLESIVFGVQPRSATVLAGVAVALAALATLATLAPALRATRSDPVEAIRAE